MYDKVKYWVIDVDGTMTDGGIYYDEHGNEQKKFNTKDAAGFFALHAVHMKIIVLTGRKCYATERRMRELKVDYLFQDILNKKAFLKEFIQKEGIGKEELAYIGDDLNDLDAMMLAGFIFCPADACHEVKSAANYVSTNKGGYGAVRDVVNHVLNISGKWDNAIREVYQLGI